MSNHNLHRYLRRLDVERSGAVEDHPRGVTIGIELGDRFNTEFLYYFDLPTTGFYYKRIAFAFQRIFSAMIFFGTDERRGQNALLGVPASQAENLDSLY